MLASRMAWYSGVSGARCASPSDLVGSCEGWPVSPPTAARRHCPLRLGYLLSSNAPAAVVVARTAASASAARVARWSMISSHADRVLLNIDVPPKLLCEQSRTFSGAGESESAGCVLAGSAPAFSRRPRPCAGAFAGSLLGPKIVADHRGPITSISNDPSLGVGRPPP